MAKEDDELPLMDEDAGAPVMPRGFAPGEMVACEACVRANPPTRMNCLYCGAVLPVGEAGQDLRRPTLRALEAWEQGFNVVLVPKVGADELSVDNLRRRRLCVWSGAWRSVGAGAYCRGASRFARGGVAVGEETRRARLPCGDGGG